MLFEHGGADGAGEVVEMILFAEGVDVWASECTTAFCAKEVESFEVVVFAVDFDGGCFCFDGEELFSDDFVAFLLKVKRQVPMEGLQDGK